MTTTTAEAAFDDILATFKATWESSVAAITGEVSPIVYAGLVGPEPVATKCWSRISQQTVMTDQAALSDVNSKRRDETTGLVIVQVFVPLTKPDGDLLSRRLSIMARKAFLRRSLSGTIWFRRARVIDLAPDGKYVRRNVVAEYTFDELN